MYKPTHLFLLALAFSFAGMLAIFSWTPAGAAGSEAGPRPGTAAPGTNRPPQSVPLKTGRADVLGNRATTTAVFATTECVAGHPDGKRCNKKTCKKDATSDCADFAAKCVEYGHHYAGTSDGGACSRVL